MLVKDYVRRLDFEGKSSYRSTFHLMRTEAIGIEGAFFLKPDYGFEEKNITPLKIAEDLSED